MKFKIESGTQLLSTNLPVHKNVSADEDKVVGFAAFVPYCFQREYFGIVILSLAE